MNRAPSPRVEANQARLARALGVARYNGGQLTKSRHGSAWAGRPTDRRLVPEVQVVQLLAQGALVLDPADPSRVLVPSRLPRG